MVQRVCHPSLKMGKGRLAHFSPKCSAINLFLYAVAANSVIAVDAWYVLVQHDCCLFLTRTAQPGLQQYLQSQWTANVLVLWRLFLLCSYLSYFSSFISRFSTFSHLVTTTLQMRAPSKFWQFPHLSENWGAWQRIQSWDTKITPYPHYCS